MTDLANKKYYFPKIEKVIIENFSLYKNKNILDLNIKDGVFCLAGANGIGKSTFLCALNYALTGGVPLGDKNFKSLKDYADSCRKFSNQFFNGRVSESDRDLSNIKLIFSIGNTKFKITKSFFDADGLSSLEIQGENKDEYILMSDKDHHASKIFNIYKEQIIRATKLQEFNQFIFLQHIVLTFDESRHLVLWDSGALEQALFLCFGTEPKLADRLELLRVQESKQDSLARNTQWQAKKLKDKIIALEDVRKQKPDFEYIELKKEYDEAIEEIKKLESSISEKDFEIEHTKEKIYLCTSEINALDREYENTFSKISQINKRIKLNPIIIKSIETHICQICGSNDENISSKIEALLEQCKCPLCTAPVIESSNKGNDPLFIELNNLDEKIDTLKRNSKDLDSVFTRLHQDRQKYIEEIYAIRNRVVEILNKNDGVIELVNNSTNSNLDQSISALKKEHHDFLNVKSDHIEERDKLRAEIDELQQKLQISYTAAEKDFVPKFRKIAHLFLGLDIEVDLNVIKNTLSLNVEIQNNMRIKQYQLSESQRFFLDIALRMAIVDFCMHNPTTLFMDTPEGSLDIAYETKAGEMFAEYAKNNNILMTANINSSHLLQELAKKCKKEKMELVRMTDWCELSEVQRLCEDLFDKAYSEIQMNL